MDADIEINNENRIRNDDTLRKGKISNQKIRHEQAYTSILSDCIWAFDDSELSTFFSEFNTYDFKWSQLLFDCTQRNKNKENLFALEFFSMGISAVTFQKKRCCRGFSQPVDVAWWFSLWPIHPNRKKHKTLSTVQSLFLARTWKKNNGNKRPITYVIVIKNRIFSLFIIIKT